MKPEGKSQTLLSITRSKAKMYEYNIPEEDHIKIPVDPARLFDIAIGLIGDFAAQINSEFPNSDLLADLTTNLRFSAYFFDSYLNSRLQKDINPYLIIIGSASYYLCDLPGSSLILANQIVELDFDLECQGLDRFLIWLLHHSFRPYLHHVKNQYTETINNISRFILEYYDSGDYISELFENVKLLRGIAYDSGTPRELLFADIICATISKRYNNSVRYSLPILSGLPVQDWSDTFKKETFIKELWPAQQLIGQKGIYKGLSAVIQMPTSAGKSRATEIVIRSAFLAKRTQLAVVVAPFRALCHEIRDSFKVAFLNEPINIDELSDVFQSDFDIQNIIGQKQILIVTPEKLL